MAEYQLAAGHLTGPSAQDRRQCPYPRRHLHRLPHGPVPRHRGGEEEAFPFGEGGTAIGRDERGTVQALIWYGSGEFVQALMADYNSKIYEFALISTNGWPVQRNGERLQRRGRCPHRPAGYVSRAVGKHGHACTAGFRADVGIGPYAESIVAPIKSRNQDCFSARPPELCTSSGGQMLICLQPAA